MSKENSVYRNNFGKNFGNNKEPIKRIEGLKSVDEEKRKNPLDNVYFDNSISIGYLKDFQKEELPTKNEVGESPITRKSMSPLVRRLTAAGLIGVTGAALTTMVSAADNGGTWANVNESSVKPLGTIESQPQVMKPNSETITQTSALAEAVKNKRITVSVSTIKDKRTGKETKIERYTFLNLKDIKTSEIIGILEKRSEAEASIKRAIQFMAGGEYLTENEAKPLALKAIITKKNEVTKTPEKAVTVVFANDDLMRAYSKVSDMEKMGCTSDGFSQSLISRIPSFNKFKKELSNNSFIYVCNGETFVFTDEDLKERNKTLIKYDKNGVKSTIVNDKAGRYYKSRMFFNDKLGICEFDGTRITGILNLKTGKVDKLSKPEFVGKLKERMVYLLEKSYKEKWASKDDQINILGLDQKDILEYKKTGSDANCKSFKIIKVSDDLGFIYVKGKYGFQNEKTLELLKLGIEKCNQVDKTIMEECVENGLNFLTVDRVTGPMFSGNDTSQWFGTYGNETVFINEKRMFGSDILISTVFEESVGLNTDAHLRADGKLEIYGKVSSFKYEIREEVKRTRTADRFVKNWPNFQKEGWGEENYLR